MGEKFINGLVKAMLVVAIAACSFVYASAQGVGISPSGTPPDNSAALDVNFTNKGLLIPRMTTVQRDAIASPAKALQIYNLDCDNINCNVGTSSAPNWVPVFVSPNLPGAAGSITGTATVCQGQNGVSYSVPAINNVASYSWAYSGTGATISDSINPVAISFSNSATSGSLTVTGKNICGQGITSSTYSITVNTISPANVNISASPPGAISTGTNVTFTASPTNGGGSPSYQWKINGSDVGVNSPTYASTALANGDIVSCVMTSDAICATNSPATSNTITMTVNAGPPPPNPEVFTYTGSNQSFPVPAGVTQVFLKMWAGGGAGGNNYSSGGAGAYVSGWLAVTPGSVLTVIVGGAGIYATSSSGSAGGFGGGGASGTGSGYGGPSAGSGYFAGSGGGRSAVQIAPGADAATAGGGGGGGSAAYQTPVYGGGGGAPNGIDGGYSSGGGGGNGHGATTGAGGTASTGADANSINGTQYTGSAGANAPFAGGGGGGGYYGGSGGGGFNSYYASNMTVGGGGGGSSYTSNLSTVTNIAGNYDNTGTNTFAGWAAPNDTDANYVAGVGRGGGYYSNGGNGLVVISW